MEPRVSCCQGSPARIDTLPPTPSIDERSCRTAAPLGQLFCAAKLALSWLEQGILSTGRRHGEKTEDFGQSFILAAHYAKNWILLTITTERMEILLML